MTKVRWLTTYVKKQHFLELSLWGVDGINILGNIQALYQAVLAVYLLHIQSLHIVLI